MALQLICSFETNASVEYIKLNIFPKDNKGTYSGIEVAVVTIS